MAQEGSRWPKIASKIAEDNPTWFKVGSSMLQGRSKTAPIDHRASQGPPESPSCFQNLRGTNVFYTLAVSPSMAS
eukprot:9012224-Pyramimonas_sp.AAC.1